MKAASAETTVLTSEWIASTYSRKLLDNISYLQDEFYSVGFMAFTETVMDQYILEDGSYPVDFMRDCCDQAMEHRMEGLSESEIVEQFRNCVAAEWEAHLAWVQYLIDNDL